MTISITTNTQRILGYVLLLAVALILGSVPTAIKEAITSVSPAMQITVRCCIAALIFTPFARNLNFRLMRDGVILGLLLFSVYATETIGLLTISANRATFIFALNIIFITLFELLFRQRLSSRIILAVVLAFSGIAFMSWESGEPIIGDLWLVGCAFLVAVYVLMLGEFSPRYPSLSLTVVQFWVTAFLTLLLSIPELTGQVEAISNNWPILIYIGVVCTAIVVWLQTVAQRWVPAYEAALLQTIEPIFGAIFAFLLLGETFRIRDYVGAAMVLVGLILVVSQSDTNDTASQACTKEVNNPVVSPVTEVANSDGSSIKSTKAFVLVSEFADSLTPQSKCNESTAHMQFSSVEHMLRTLQPTYPVICLYSERITRQAKFFTDHFPGKVLYAVKCNSNPIVLNQLYKAGIHGFDTASLTEIDTLSTLLPQATCYFNHPIKSRFAIKKAYETYGVRDYVVDSAEELDKLVAILGKCDITTQVRLKTVSGFAVKDLSLKFGACVDEGVELLRKIESMGMMPAISFHVGSQCLNPQAYTVAIEQVKEVLERSPVSLRYLNVGGGFPGYYRGKEIPSMLEFFAAIANSIEQLQLPKDCKVFCEPGRGLVWDSCSVVVQVHTRSGNKIYINDGVHGSLPGINYYKLTPPTKLIRLDSPPAQELTNFQVFGPTCDSIDALECSFTLPIDLQEGDWIEIGESGAYSYALTRYFNGFCSDTVIEIC
ncbi:EamA family transporter [Nostoc sphaeroides]|uniref:ornithine decarboxylase n=1 Tax=Nostoc sphaeroides CCNUC1 TaxID=2653204 RepID=A0A5P8WIX1_9NOSO|nr:EamA family transporter [Nostoc sphaeroides]QFS52521.1 ornithine decarboxylase [Nostoc sphaeroides CCNUC1]